MIEMDLRTRVLVVDDTPTMRLIVTGMLEELGFEAVAQAEDAEVAWEMLQASADGADRFGLVLADWNMPGMSGVELLRSIRAHSTLGGLPFVMMTSRNDQAHIAEAMKSGASSYLVKPFGPVELRERIEQTLAPHRSMPPSRP